MSKPRVWERCVVNGDTTITIEDSGNVTVVEQLPGYKMLSREQVEQAFYDTYDEEGNRILKVQDLLKDLGFEEEK